MQYKNREATSIGIWRNDNQRHSPANTLLSLFHPRLSGRALRHLVISQCLGYFVLRPGCELPAASSYLFQSFSIKFQCKRLFPPQRETVCFLTSVCPSYLVDCYIYSFHLLKESPLPISSKCLEEVHVGPSAFGH